jgi:hypothetical protein
MLSAFQESGMPIISWSEKDRVIAVILQELPGQWHALVQDALAASSLERELRVELLDCLLDHIRALLAQYVHCSLSGTTDNGRSSDLKLFLMC